MQINILKNPYFIISAMIVGIFFGYFFPQFVSYIKFIGDLFISLLKMLIIPVIFFTVIVAIAKLAYSNSATKVMSITAIYFVISSIIASAFGVLLTLMFKPGVGISNLDTSNLVVPDSLNLQSIPKYGFVDFISSIIPKNPFHSLMQGDMLQVLFFAIVFGLSLAYISNSFKDKFINGLEVVNDALMNILGIILYITPFAVFSLSAYLVSTLGVSLFYYIAKVIVLGIFSGIFWIYIVLGVIIVLFTNISYKAYVKNIIPLQVTAFTTASSLASLPTNMEVSEKMGLSKHLYQIILPIGAVMHKNGAAMYYTMVVIFCAQLFNIELSTGVLISIIIVATLSALATPGIPGFSLAVLLVMGAANVPLVAIPIIIAVDRVLDMFLTVSNVVADTVCVAFVDKIIKK